MEKSTALLLRGLNHPHITYNNYTALDEFDKNIHLSTNSCFTQRQDLQIFIFRFLPSKFCYVLFSVQPSCNSLIKGILFLDTNVLIFCYVPMVNFYFSSCKSWFYIFEYLTFSGMIQTAKGGNSCCNCSFFCWYTWQWHALPIFSKSMPTRQWRKVNLSCFHFLWMWKLQLRIICSKR